MNKYLLVLLAGILLLAACSTPTTSSTNGSALKVLSVETFLGDIAQNVAGDRVKVDILLPVAVDPHEFQPAPADAIRITRSQILIVNGAGYETWLTKTLQDVSGNRQVIVASNGLTPNPDPSGTHPEGDPHLWMNPLNVIHYVEVIRDGLSQADPAGKDAYTQNASTYISRLTDLDQWVKTQVAQIPPDQRLLVTNHDALGYLAQAYGFKVIGAVIPNVSTEASPSAQQMASLIDAIKSTGARAIFLDANENPNLASQIASESGARVVTGLYVESLSSPSGPAPTYIDMIKYDVSLIVGALK